MHRQALRLARSVAVVLVCLGVLGIERAAADGIGVYPADLAIDNALRGTEYFRTIGITNDADGARTFSLEASGETGAWVSFVDITDRTTPANKVHVPARSEGRVFLRLRIPADTPNGTYSGRILVVTAGGKVEDSSGSAVNVNVGAEIGLTVVTTGTQRLGGELVDITVADTETGHPLQVKSIIQNSGNVQARPQTAIKISTSATVVDESTLEGDPIAPNETRTVVTEWDTAKAPPGAYLASVSVALGGNSLGSRQLRFRILPQGALTRQGSLQRIELLNKPEPGTAAKLRATFVNTGQIDSRVVFVGELYRGDTLVKAVSSPEKLVPQGQFGSLDVVVEVPRRGSYTLRGKANFEGKESEVRELRFTVGSSSSRSEYVLAGAAGGGTIVLLAAAIAVVRRSRLRASRLAGA